MTQDDQGPQSPRRPHDQTAVDDTRSPGDRGSGDVRNESRDVRGERREDLRSERGDDVRGDGRSEDASRASEPYEQTALREDRDGRRETTTATDADVSGRMTGTHRTADDRQERSDAHDHDRSDRDDRSERHDGSERNDVRERRVVEEPRRELKHKTSAAAVFALVFGLAALFCALTAILSPLAVLFGLIGLVLGIVGLGKARRPGVTGKGVAVGGLVMSLLGLLLGAAVIAGLSVLINDEARLDQLQSRLDDLRNDLPTGTEVRESVDPS